eukprot:6017163-Amphidinium_carterae.2
MKGLARTICLSLHSMLGRHCRSIRGPHKVPLAQTAWRKKWVQERSNGALVLVDTATGAKAYRGGGGGGGILEDVRMTKKSATSAGCSDTSKAHPPSTDRDCT